MECNVVVTTLGCRHPKVKFRIPKTGLQGIRAQSSEYARDAESNFYCSERLKCVRIDHRVSSHSHRFRSMPVIAVLGDSLSVDGYGIKHASDTWPMRLQGMLGDPIW